MYMYMRTTLDIDDQLAVEAKKLAIEEHTSLKALVERGLRLVLRGGDKAPKDALTALRGLGKNAWKGVDPDHYVRETRKGWQ